MNILLLIAFIGVAVSVTVAKDISEDNLIDWRNSIWNWYRDETDVRGPNMKCIENYMHEAIGNKRDEMKEFGKSFKQWKNGMKTIESEQKVSEFRKGAKMTQEFLNSFLSIYDLGVTTCRNDDKFSMVNFVDKFMDLFSNMDDSAMKEFISKIGDDHIINIEQYGDKYPDQLECYTKAIIESRNCVKHNFNLQVYEEKGPCGTNYKKMIECFEHSAHQCFTDNQSEVTALGSVVFRFFYDICHA